MPAVTTNQGLSLPIDADTADNPVAFTNYTAGVEGRLAMRFTTVADRTTRVPVPVENQLSFLSTDDRVEVYDGTNWISLFSRGLYANLRKVTAQIATPSSTVLQNDNTLLTALPTAGTFGFRCALLYDTSTTADFKIAFTWPAGATAEWGMIGVATTGAAGVGDGTFLGTNVSGTAIAVGGAGVGNVQLAIVEGDITMGGTAGNLQLQFAQNTSDATNSTMRARSRMQAWRSA